MAVIVAESPGAGPGDRMLPMPGICRSAQGVPGPVENLVPPRRGPSRGGAKWVFGPSGSGRLVVASGFGVVIGEAVATFMNRPLDRTWSPHIERVDPETKRRADVVRVLPDHDTVTRLK